VLLFAVLMVKRGNKLTTPAVWSGARRRVPAYAETGLCFDPVPCRRGISSWRYGRYVVGILRDPGRVAESLLDVLGLQMWILIHDLAGVHPVRNHADNERDRDTYIADACLATKDIRIGSDAVETNDVSTFLLAACLPWNLSVILAANPVLRNRCRDVIRFSRKVYGCVSGSTCLGTSCPLAHAASIRAYIPPDTSECPPMITGTGVAMAASVSARTNGSATLSGCRRSE
jgi:hypothetical protein